MIRSPRKDVRKSVHRLERYEILQEIKCRCALLLRRTFSLVLNHPVEKRRYMDYRLLKPRTNFSSRSISRAEHVAKRGSAEWRKNDEKKEPTPRVVSQKSEGGESATIINTVAITESGCVSLRLYSPSLSFSLSLSSFFSLEPRLGCRNRNCGWNRQSSSPLPAYPEHLPSRKLPASSFHHPCNWVGVYECSR